MLVQLVQYLLQLKDRADVDRATGAISTGDGPFVVLSVSSHGRFFTIELF
jgi:hypothetical protein